MHRAMVHVSENVYKLEMRQPYYSASVSQSPPETIPLPGISPMPRAISFYEEGASDSEGLSLPREQVESSVWLDYAMAHDIGMQALINEEARAATQIVICKSCHSFEV
jgi:hypothetical protein